MISLKYLYSVYCCTWYELTVLWSSHEKYSIFIYILELDAKVGKPDTVEEFNLFPFFLEEVSCNQRFMKYWQFVPYRVGLNSGLSYTGKYVCSNKGNTLLNLFTRIWYKLCGFSEKVFHQKIAGVGFAAFFKIIKSVWFVIS